MATFTKAYGLLNKGLSTDAVYVANCLDELIKQLSGIRHNDEFHGLFLRLLSRVFGENVSLVGVNTEDTNWVKGVPGGWLKQICETYSKSTNNDSNDEFQFFSPGAAKLLRHFAYKSSLFELLSDLGGECNTRLSMFPHRSQLYIADHPSYVPLQSDNSMKILCLLLKANSIIPVQVRSLLLIFTCCNFFLRGCPSAPKATCPWTIFPTSCSV